MSPLGVLIAARIRSNRCTGIMSRFEIVVFSLKIENLDEPSNMRW
jgi:hypothetical protein